MCRAKLKGFASHIPVLYREVPFILNISGAACSYRYIHESRPIFSISMFQRSSIRALAAS
jgi:hypothetical protein